MIGDSIRRAILIAALLLFRTAEGAPTHELVASFPLAPQTASLGALVLGPDGFYWGTTQNGGTHNRGTIYKISADGTSWFIVHSFSGSSTNGRGYLPYGGLSNDGAGYLWGTTSRGGVYNKGTAWEAPSL